ncbi:hypothetical protein HMPREF0044_1511 [Gleimia coleocanis DSM 15436]|uniref:Uncharacterized protein n=1 Tax=Gleimia coleocanis DSM 15436 TaxID=525245 RepID=C0W258_9ACTO|nr:hypothetical protein [Gleimia coleocanis]EEH63272.1 hypothetical protein HMPREF0044_1511 [Gleimia coleocanis DSM 15436]
MEAPIQKRKLTKLFTLGTTLATLVLATQAITLTETAVALESQN